MARNYQREERDRRRHQPPYSEEGQWSNGRSDDDFSMVLGQESRGPHEDYRQGQEPSGGRSWGRGTMRPNSQYSGRESDYYGQSDYRRGDSGWNQGDEGFQNSSRWQRSQFRPSGADFGGPQQYGGGWYEGQDARYRGEGQFAGRGPRNYKRSDDRIEEDINERLTRHGMLDATDIEVTVQNGEVTLSGSVDSRQAKRYAEDVSDGVFGVREIHNQIKIKQRGESSERSESKHDGETGGNQKKAS